MFSSGTDFIAFSFLLATKVSFLSEESTQWAVDTVNGTFPFEGGLRGRVAFLVTGI